MILKIKQIDQYLPLKPGKQLLFAIVILLFSAWGCVLDDFVESQTPTPPPQVSSDYLRYISPIYNVTLLPGQSLPGTRLQYVNRADNIYNVTIDGQPLTRQGGDSLPWQGVISPGVFAKFNMRITPSFGVDSLIAVGPVELFILNHTPVGIPTLPLTTAGAYHYAGIPVAESIAVNQTLPGTTLIYTGQTNQGAGFLGTTEFPYRAQGDSLVWVGQLRNNVYIRLNLRVISFNEQSVNVGGTADIWVIPIR
jgi:hypothetical protein